MVPQNITINYSVHNDNNMPFLLTYQQDNELKHTSKLVKQWFETNQIEVRKWPAQSVDLNRIENLWYQVELALRHKGPFKNVDLKLLKPRRMRSNKKKLISKSMLKRCSITVVEGLCSHRKSGGSQYY